MKENNTFFIFPNFFFPFTRNYFLFAFLLILSILEEYRTNLFLLKLIKNHFSFHSSNIIPMYFFPYSFLIFTPVGPLIKQNCGCLDISRPHPRDPLTSTASRGSPTQLHLPSSKETENRESDRRRSRYKETNPSTSCYHQD